MRHLRVFHCPTAWQADQPDPWRHALQARRLPDRETYLCIAIPGQERGQQLGSLVALDFVALELAALGQAACAEPLVSMTISSVTAFRYQE